jgi:hypothetical protein
LETSAGRREHAEIRRSIDGGISIDRNGEAVLAEMMSQGAEFIVSDVYTKHLLRNLRVELKRSRIKGKQDGSGND